MLGKRLLDRHTTLHIRLDLLVSLDQLGHEVDDGVDLVLWDHDDAFHRVREYDVSLRREVSEGLYAWKHDKNELPDVSRCP